MARRWPTRRWLLASLVLAALAACAGSWVLRPPDPLEAARRRVPLGADMEAVEAVLGQPKYSGLSYTAESDDGRRLFIWKYGEYNGLHVEFDADGRAVKAGVSRWRDPTLWERCRGWLGW